MEEPETEQESSETELSETKFPLVDNGKYGAGFDKLPVEKGTGEIPDIGVKGCGPNRTNV